MINCAEDPRCALELTRYHSWPRVRDQSNGEHSCQILRILLTVWPDCPRRMLVHAVTHDMGEMAGDIQYPFKVKYPMLKSQMIEIEMGVRRGMSATIGMPPETVLGEYELMVFKIVESLEMWEYGLREQGLGNKYARIIALRNILAASQLIEMITDEMRGSMPDVRPAVKSYVNRRTEWENQND